MRSFIGTFSFIVLFLCIGCNSNRDGKYVKKLFGQEIDFEMLINNSVNKCDSIWHDDNSVKIVSYVDSMLCTSCLVDYLKRAEEFLDSLGNDRIDFICIIHPRKSSYEEIQEAFPIIDDLKDVYLLLDTENLYAKRNGIEKVPSSLRCFLINENNQVLLIGDPLRIYEIQQLYKKKIPEIRNESILRNPQQ